jgi:hypothetical protein
MSDIPTYGNFRKPKTVGLHDGLSLGLSLAVLVISSIVILLLLRQAWSAALAVVVVGALIIGTMSFTDIHGLSIADRWMEILMFGIAKRRGRTLYRSGPLGVIPSSATPLPGILGGSKVSEHLDSFDRTFALVHHADKSVAVVMSVTPPGIDLIDRDQINTSVAQWGEWLAMLGNEIGVVQASVVIESSPDTGEALTRHIHSMNVVGASSVAHDVMNEVAAEYKVGAAQIRVWVTVTFQPSLMSSKKRTVDELARDIGGRLTGITQQLKAAGAGAVHLMTASHLSRAIRTAYDPAALALFEIAQSRGEQVDLAWEDAGPIAAEALWDAYRHDSGLSRTWVVSQPPQGVFYENVLKDLLQISADVERKRVAIIYKPISAARTGSVVEQDQNRASNAVTVGGGNRARARREARIAERNANEEAAGAGVEDFAIIITATTSDDELEDVSSVIRALASSSKLARIRVAYGAQDSAFALGLPLGVRPSSSIVKGM